MAKVYIRKRKDTYIEVDPQIIRWRNKLKQVILFEKRPQLGRPKGKKKPTKFPSFF